MKPLGGALPRPVSDPATSVSLWGNLLVILATGVWATSGLFVTRIIQGSNLTPLSLAFWRELVTFFVLLCGLALFRPSLLRIRRADLPWLAGMGMIGFSALHFSWNTAVMLNGAAVSTVIQSNSPIFVTILAWFLWREPLTWRKWVAIGLALIGTVLIARPGSLGNIRITPTGFLAAIAVALAYSAVTLFTKKLGRRYHAWTIMVYAFGAACLTLLPFQIGRPLPVATTPVAVVCLLALVFVTTISGYAIYALGMRRTEASVASILGTAEVPFGALVGYLFLAERLDGWQVVGAIAVVCGVLLLSVTGRRTPADQPSGLFKEEYSHVG